MSLKTRVIRGVFWTTVSSFGTQLLIPLANLVLAKLLAPSDFGLMAIAQLVIVIIQVFQDFGLARALIYRSDDTEQASHTAFFLIVSWSMFLYLATVMAAPFIALFFAEPDVKSVIQIMALTLLISSFGTVPSALMEKNLEFKKKLLPELLSIAGYVIIAVGLALAEWGIWSIVWGRIGQTILTVALIWIVSGWRLRFSFDQQIAREILGYGKYLLAASFLSIIFLNIDNTYIGKLLGVEALGFYTFAFAIANLSTTSISFIVNRVTFPSYVKLRANQAVLSRAYLHSFRLVSTLVFPLTLGLVILSPHLLHVFYGDKWNQSIIPLQILSFYALFRSLGRLGNNMLLTLGKQSLIPKLLSIYVIALAILLWPATQWFNIVGASLIMTSVIIVGAIIWTILANYYLAISAKSFIKNLVSPTIASIIMLCCLLILTRLLEESFLSLTILATSGTSVYIVSILLITRGEAYKEAADIIKTLLNTKEISQSEF